MKFHGAAVAYTRSSSEYGSGSSGEKYWVYMPPRVAGFCHFPIMVKYVLGASRALIPNSARLLWRSSIISWVQRTPEMKFSSSSTFETSTPDSWRSFLARATSRLTIVVSGLNPGIVEGRSEEHTSELQ